MIRCNYNGMDSVVPDCFEQKKHEPWYCIHMRFVGQCKQCAKEQAVMAIETGSEINVNEY